MVLDVAKRHLAGDEQVDFRLEDGARFLQSWTGEQFDLVFADTWPGKFNELDLALSLVSIGGMYLIDDLLPQTSWPPEHGAKVTSLIDDLRSREGFVAVQMSWSSGIMVLVRTHAV